MNFECHITLTNSARFELITSIGKLNGFHFSKIDGDEELGPGIKCYLTKSSDHIPNLIYDMEQVTDRLELHDITWIKRKIECIILSEMNIR